LPNIGRAIEQNRYQVQSVARAARLLDVIADEGASGLSVTEIAMRLGVAKSTALALARTLAAAGLLRDVMPGPRYVLGSKLLRLGEIVGRQTSIGELGVPTLHGGE
jgi:DNA-binding IclR family transcriptional regulator